MSLKVNLCDLALYLQWEAASTRGCGPSIIEYTTSPSEGGEYS